MKRADVVIIGGGASGMMAAAKAVKHDVSVLIIEKMERPGRKIRITGKGRCNITNTKSWEDFSSHIHPNPQFFKHAFFEFSNTQTINFFNEIGLSTIQERGSRIFPESGKATDVVDRLYTYLQGEGVGFVFNSRVISANISDNGEFEIDVKSGNKIYKIYSRTLVIATGGLSYPSTGSDGDGYELAKKFGHSIKSCFPSLTALKLKGFGVVTESFLLKNSVVSLFVDGKMVQQEFGDAEFTNNGFEGSIGYKISRNAVSSFLAGKRCSVEFDLKPAIDNEQLVKRIVREIYPFNKMTINALLRKLIPPLFINSVCGTLKKRGNEQIGLDDNLIITEIANALKNLKFEINGFTSYERAVVTAGGVDTKEIISKSMQSRIVKNLYFAGEVIDLDGDTGGYNLQIAFSTGALAGRCAAQSIKRDGKDIDEVDN